MKKTVSLAILFAAAAAAALGACAQGTTDFETDEGDGGEGGSGGPPTSTGSASGCSACDVNATCDQSSGEPVCVCKAGYMGSGVACADVDECAANPGLCTAGTMCINEPGGYSCSCAPGFEDSNGVCVDINECAVNAGGCAAGCKCLNQQGGAPTCDCMLTLSNSQDIIPASSASCNNGTDHTDNSYYRVFDLAALGVDGDFKVTDVEVGIESATSSLGTQPVQVKLYELTGALAVANLTSIGTASVNVSDTIQSIFLVSVSGTAAASSKLVVEFFTPTGAGNLLYVGSNNAGEAGPTYIRAIDCMLNEPMTAASIGFPAMHMVMNVYGTYTKTP